MLNQIDALKSSLSTLKTQSSSSIFKSKSIKSSNENRITAVASSSAVSGSYNLRVNQLAKNDTILSLDKNSNDLTSISTPGDYSFYIKVGDGEGGYLNSKITVTLNESDFTSGSISYSSLANKINQSITDDSAKIISNSVSGLLNDNGSFIVDFGGTEYTINYSSGDYEQVLDDVINQLNEITGISAEKIASEGSFILKVQSGDNTKYLQFKNDSASLLTQLGITTDKEIAASKIISSSVFSPNSGTTQISFATKKSGYDYRITELADINTSGLLSVFGLNIGSSRPDFVQNESGEDTPGFIYQLNQLNSKLTFNGIQVQRNSNEINDLISGVNLKLLSLSSSEEAEVTLSITNNATEIKSKIENFITRFNELYSYLRENSSTTKDKRGLLVGDSTASSIMNLMSNFAINPLQGFSASSINSLSKLGITFNVTTGLSISNETQLTDAIENNITQVESFFNSDQGFANLFFNAIDPYSGAAGYIKKAQNQLTSSITYLNDSITNSEQRISKAAERLRAQYQKLQTQLATLLSNQSYFMGNIFGQQGY
jgi:flagellar hook-associated protein 2